MSNNPDNGSTDRQHFVKGAEVFVGGLSQSLTETKIREVFSTCGEITEIRMITDKKGNSKGYCFVRFSTKEAATKAVKDKAGIMLEGRKIGVLPSTEQNSLFFGNLPKDWNQDKFDKLVRQVFPDVDSVNLVMLSSDRVTHSQKEKNRGFGFVQFSSHAAAARAYKLGSRPEFVLGSKCHPTVKWVEEEPELDPQELSKVKVAFIRDLPMDVSEGFLEKMFGPFGEIERVVLSKKGQSQVGFVHFASRQDLDNAVEEMHNKTVQGPKSGSFKLQVEVARPMEKSKKRAREGTSGTPTNITTQSKVLKSEPPFISSGSHVLREFKESSLVTDPYEAAILSLPVAIKDRLLRILRLGIATRYDIDVRCLRSLEEIPESAAISVLDQFLLSGGDEIDKGSYLAGLITKYQARSLGIRQISAYTSRANEFSSVRSDLTRLPSRSQLPVVDSYSSHMPNSRYERYSPRLSYLEYSNAPQSRIARIIEERNTSPALLSGSSPNLGRGEVHSPVLGGASHQPTRSRVRFDPFTGEPYKFDPFTGEPIQPESLSRSSYRTLY